MSSASVKFLPFLSFIVPILAWNSPLISPVFLKISQVFPILLFSCISLHWSPRKAFLSLLASLWNSAFTWEYLSIFLNETDIQAVIQASMRPRYRQESEIFWVRKRKGEKHLEIQVEAEEEAIFLAILIPKTSRKAGMLVTDMAGGSNAWSGKVTHQIQGSWQALYI